MTVDTPKWVSRESADEFRRFCEQHGHETREHSDPFKNGFQVRHKGHWMAVVWNKAWNRYTADRRLGLLVQSFAAERKSNDR
ncbi:hypothetical protein [Bordetella petrii]|uniref:hypothetical protein n=1 Tax=Bordetella petrii TaxID=94624 RepID=UPI000491DC49|nr:hypothetical protein [Bordetella petrii]